MEVLSVEVVRWASGGAGGKRQQVDGNGGGESGERAKLEQVLASLKLFLVSKVEVKKPASGQVAGSTACLEVLGGIRAGTGEDRDLAGLTGAARDDSDARRPSLALADAYWTERDENLGQPPSSSVSPPPPPPPPDLSGFPLDDSWKADRDQPVGEKNVKNVRMARAVCDAPSRGAGTRHAVACADALEWLPSLEREREGGMAVAAAPAAAAAASRGGRSNSSGSSSSSNIDDDDGGHAPTAATGLLLRARCAALPPKAVLDAVRRAWAQDSFEGEEAAKERRRSAAFALYEAGIEAGALAEDTHWASATAGVVDLDLSDYRGNEALPMAALNLVLIDMLRRYAFEEDVSG
ncbi:unnamed protein product [Laminaria digitata]